MRGYMCTFNRDKICGILVSCITPQPDVIIGRSSCLSQWLPPFWLRSDVRTKFQRVTIRPSTSNISLLIVACCSRGSAYKNFTEGNCENPRGHSRARVRPATEILTARYHRATLFPRKMVEKMVIYVIAKHCYSYGKRLILCRISHLRLISWHMKSRRCCS